jgi:hypothetical protein
MAAAGFPRGDRQSSRLRNIVNRGRWYCLTQDERVHPRTSDPDDDGFVFILYAVVAGLVIGLLTGGSATRLGELRFRWAPLIVLGMAAQVLLFSTPVGDASGGAAPVAYVASNVAVLAVVFRNLAIPGLGLVLVGGSSNLLAVVANGGYMPAGAAAVAALDRSRPEGYSNSRVADAVILGPLTDLFAMPGWVPLANVFSVGDVLIGIGSVIAVVATMHGRGPVEARTDEAGAAPDVAASPPAPTAGASLH